MSKTEKPWILLVDDNEATCTLMTALLQREFGIEAASDGLEAVEKLRTKQYRAILLDLRMPQYDGFSVLEFLRQNQPDMLKRVLIVTALLGREEIARARSYNVCGVIAKPFEIETLLSAVKQCTGSPDPAPLGGVFCTPVIILIADLLQKKLL